MSGHINGITTNGISTNGIAKKCLKQQAYKSVTNIPATLEPDYSYPNLPSRCTWDTNEQDQVSPHTKRPL